MVERGKRIRFKFIKTGDLKYISHLDLLRTMERATRRSRLPIRYTEGFHPRAKIQFTSALPVGIASLGELMDIELTEELLAGQAMQEMGGQLPATLALKEARVVPPGEGPPMSLVRGASYQIRVEPQDDLAQKVDGWLAKETIPWTRQQKNKVRHLDLRGATSKLEVLGREQLELLLFFSSEATNVRPQEIIASLKLVPLEIVRTAIWGQGVLMEPLEKGIE